MAIFTISRQMGSLGDSIAHQIAERLNAPLLDRDEIVADPGRYDLSVDGEQLPLELVERAPTLLERLRRERGLYTAILRSALYNLAAGQEHAVIVGLGGQVFFAPFRQVVRALLIAPFDTRVERMEENFPDRESAARAVRQHDAERSGYHRYVHQVEWLNPELYHLVINTGQTQVEATVELLVHTAQLPDFQWTPESRQDLEDRALAALVESKLAADPGVPADRVVVQVRRGRVSISGVVDSELERNAVERIVSQIPRVVDITNDLTLVRPGVESGV